MSFQLLKFSRVLLSDLVDGTQQCSCLRPSLFFFLRGITMITGNYWHISSNFQFHSSKHSIINFQVALLERTS